ncbi:MAG: S-adenosylmethionine decarboxylase related protein [Atribacteria bacterium 34_128]|nr:MAG: S-adenosylmethionine decarboxylase related protein [Atribacteria bacterium 34_128]
MEKIKELKEKFSNENIWGLLTSIDLHYCNPKIIRDAEAIKQYVNKLCQIIEMKRYGDTQVVNFGKEERVAGFSMTQLIETSLISGHFANQSNAAYIDVFSCKYYNPQVVADFTQKYFQAKDITIHYILRK